jgi:hypothetical protein
MPRKITPAARFNALVASLTADLAPDGAPLTAAEAAFVRLAAANILSADEIAEAVKRGDKIDQAELVRLTNAGSRIVRDLRIVREQRAATLAAKPGASPLDQIVAQINAEKAARGDEPEDEDDDEPFERPALDAEPTTPATVFEAAPVAAIVGEPEPIEPEPVTPPKRGPLSIAYDTRPRSAIDPQGSTLSELIADLLTVYAPTTAVTITTPAEVTNGATLADAATSRAAAPLANRPNWYIR